MAKRSFNRPPSGYTQYPSVTLPERWPLVSLLAARDVSFDKDARLVNAYAEMNKQTEEFDVVKRPGHTLYATFGSGAGRGLTRWVPYNVVSGGGLYAVVGTSLYKNGVSIGTVSGSGKVYFEEMLEGPYMVMGSASSTGYFTDGSTVTAIVDPDFPDTDRCPGFAYLNGVIYVLRYDGAIQGSDLGNPAAWDPLNVIIARSRPDQGVTITRQLGYIAAFKQYTTEFFEDVGNATGSRLQVIDGAFLNFGCSDADTLVNMDDLIIWVTSSKETNFPQVGVLKDLTMKIVSTPQIDRLLQLVSTYSTSAISAYPLKVAGHRFYVLNIDVLPVSLVLDLDTGLWHYWANPAGTAHLPYAFSSPAYVTDTTAIVQRLSDGVLFAAYPHYIQPTDNTEIFSVDIYTPNFDFGVNRSKQLNMKFFNSDQTPGSILHVRYSDDDYETYSNFRRVDLGLKRPSLDNEGTFHRRSYHYRHACATPLRLRSCDHQIDIGTF